MKVFVNGNPIEVPGTKATYTKLVGQDGRTQKVFVSFPRVGNEPEVSMELSAEEAMALSGVLECSVTVVCYGGSDR